MSEASSPCLLDMDQVKIDPAWALRIPPSLALRRKVLPFSAIDGRVYVACVDQHDIAALQAVERHVNLPISPQPADPDSLQRALDRLFGGNSTAGRRKGAPLRAGKIDARAAADPDSEDAVGLCEELLYAAVIRQASDIHIDPDPENVQVRFRVDGVLEHYRKLPKAAQGGVISRFKVVGGMDIAEKRAPQDGRFTHAYGPSGEAIDIRVATLPTRHGERMTLRLLAIQTESLTLEKLGMSRAALNCFERSIDKPHGMILLTGPTGSGKSTTLYAAIRRLIGRKAVNVITIEDPVEYEMPGVAQVEVDSADKVSFSKALRSVLRHDPDVVMIGEIRDRETADVAIKAALTGHLVLSTLHTNSAASAITRMSDMEVQRYLIAATMRLSVAQRLVRRICSHCRQPRPLTEEEAAALNCAAAAGQTVYEPGGCMYCANRGYVGRLGLFELLPIDESLSRSIAHGVEESEIVAHMRQQQMARLIDDALEKLLAGQTTVREVLAAVTIW